MRWALLLVVLLPPGLGLAADAGTVDKPLPSPDDLARLAVLWHERGDEAKAREGLQLATSALTSSPQDPDRMFWTARFQLWVGDSLSDSKEKKRLGKEAWELGDRLAKAKPDWVAGPYFGTAGIALYSQGIGIVGVLTEGLDSKFRARMERAIALDPRFEHSAPRLAKGRYYYEMPWPKHDLGKSVAWYRQALADDPENLRARAWLAETLWRNGDIAGAQAELVRVRDGHVADDPAEEERAKAIGRHVEREMAGQGSR